jgi:hypothetical protein
VLFKVGTQSHRLFFELQGTRPELMVASDPESVRTYLAHLSLRSMKHGRSTAAPTQ